MTFSWPGFALILCLFLGAGRVGAGAEVTLIGGKTNAVVVMPDAPAAETRAGAELLQTYIEKSTSQRVTLDHASRVANSVSPRLYVGRSPFVNERIGAKLDALSPDGFIIQAEGDAVILAGRTPFADKSAALEFLRRYCGCEWYMPGPLWEVVKHQATLAIPTGVSVVEPTFRSRWHSGLNNRMNTAANWAWEDMQRAANRYAFHHSAAAAFPPALFAKDHPDVYALVNGVRRVPGPGSLEGWQVCMTNPRVVDRYLEVAADLFKAGSPYLSISVSPNDGKDFCECENCRKFYSDKDTEKQKCTRLVFHLVNEVAQRIHAKWPDKLVGIMSYSCYSDPVSDLRVEPNVVLYLVGCRQGYGNPETKALYDGRILAWQKVGVKHFGLYEWYNGSAYNVPPLYMHVLADSMRFAVQHGADGWYSEDYPSWGLQGPAHWVVARLLWDVNQNVDALLDQFCTNLFGPAAGSMRAYFRRCEEQWTQFGAAGGDWAAPNQYDAYPPAVRRELRAVLTRAERESANDPVAHERVLFFSKSFGFSERMASWYEAGNQAVAAIAKRDFTAALAALGSVSKPDDDPIQYMKRELDPIPLALYYKSDYLDKYVLSGLKSALQAKTEIATSILNESGREVLAHGPITAAAVERALQDAFARYLPAKPTPDMQQAVAAVKEYAGKAVFAPEVATPPTVDGDLSDAAWKQATEATGFYAYVGGTPANYRTTFKLVRHGNRLYAGFDCYQNMEGPKAGGTVRDSNVWLDDAIEMFLNRPDATDPKDFCQVIVNVKGVIFDQWQGNAKWNGDIQAGTRLYADHWSLEVSIPLREIHMTPTDTRGLRFNVVRDVWGQGNLAQISAWYPTTFGHADLNLRGWLFFP